MKKLSIVALIITLTCLMLTGCFTIEEPEGYIVTKEEYEFLQSIDIETFEQISNFQLLMEVLGYCNENYYYDIDFDQVDIAAAMGVVNSLDRYSSLQVASGIASSSAGIGLRLDVTMYNEYRINYVHPNSPADTLSEGGTYAIERGDHIYKVNGYRVEGADIKYFNAISAGGVGTALELTIKRDGEILDEVFNCVKASNIFKESYYINNIEGLPQDIGYIKLLSFTGTAKEDFVSNLNQFMMDNNEFLILDLRGNGGGSSDILQDIAGYLINDQSNSEQIPIIELHNTDGDKIVYKTKQNNYINKPIAILVNGATASASEALISAMSYYGTGVIIGDTTYGKGTALNPASNTVFNKYDINFYLSIVVGEYFVYTDDLDSFPEGLKNIDIIGITPDIVVENREFEIELSNDHDIIAALEYYSSLQE